jgi:hypothetical protein
LLEVAGDSLKDKSNKLVTHQSITSIGWKADSISPPIEVIVDQIFRARMRNGQPAGRSGLMPCLSRSNDAGKLNKHLQWIRLTDGISSAQIEGTGILPNRLFQKRRRT